MAPLPASLVTTPLRNKLCAGAPAKPGTEKEFSHFAIPRASVALSANYAGGVHG